MPVNLTATPLQIEFITCAYRFLAFFAGRRFGKTYALRIRVCKRALTERNLEITYITPLSAQAREVYRAIIKDNSIRHRIVKKAERPYPEIIFDTGSRIKFRSMQRPEGIRSTGEDEVILDEIQDPVYTEEDIDAIVMPLLGDRRGTLIIAGQFRGHNWYYKRFFVPGQSPVLLDVNGRPTGTPNHLYRSWQIDSKHGHCFQGPEGEAEYALQISLVPKAVADQEWRCIPTANIRAVFDFDHLEWMRQNSPAKHSAPQPGARYVIGLDLGGRFDYSAMTVMQWLESEKKGHVVDVVKFPLRTDHATQARRVAIAAERWRAPVVADNTGGAVGGYGQVDAVFRYYRENIRDLREFSFNVKTKGLMVRNMTMQIEQQRLTIPTEFSELYDQLAKYEWEYKNGLYRYGAPQGEHDDVLVSCGLAIEGGLRGWVGGGNGVAVSAALY